MAVQDQVKILEENIEKLKEHFAKVNNSTLGEFALLKKDNLGEF
jgi:hypothetical protein